MKNILKKITVLTFVIFVIGCNSDYFDVNTPYNATKEENLAMNDLLAPALYHTFMAQYYAEKSLGNYTQYFTGQSGGAIVRSSIPGTWEQIYLYVLPNINTIIKKAKEKNAPHFEGIAKTLIAVNLGLATDCWGNIPFKDASEGVKNLKPTFDKQEDIYKEIDKLLSDAISLLKSTDNSLFKPNSKGDFIYKGKTDKWIKLAYTLKARYKLHLSEVNGNSDMTTIISDISKGFTTNGDDFQMSFTEKNINPWYSIEVLSKKTGNNHDKIGDQLVNYMNGTTYPFSSIAIDPRLPVYATKDDKNAKWRGYVTGGEGISSDGEKGNTYFVDGGFYTNTNAPIILISHTEALFIKAEALFIANGGNTKSTGSTEDVYNTYIQGIKENMKKLGVATASANNYISEPSIGMGKANIMLHHIMKEKYIANFLNAETYVDFRRYDFSTDVFKDLALPIDNAKSEFPGKWIVRLVYPSSEESRNPKNVNQNKQAPTEPVWWDK